MRNCRKWLAMLLAAALMLSALPALAQEATALPFGLSFDMDYDAVKIALADIASEGLWNAAAEDQWDEGTGQFMLDVWALGIGDMMAEYSTIQVDTNNSTRVSRLSQIFSDLPFNEMCVADFRTALAALTAAYGQPDTDPFDESAVEQYVEFGNLSATWTKPDVRICLSLSRMYQDSLNLSFTNRLCFDPADLK